MKMHKRIGRKAVATATLAVLALSASACGGGGGSDAEASDDTYTVGYVGALSGPLGASGRLVVDGLKAGAEYANDNGDITFEVVERDSKGDPTSAANLARELAQGDVDAIYAGTTDFAAIQPVANQYKIPVADSGGVTAVLDKLGDDNEFPWGFCTNPSCGAPSVLPQIRFLQEAGTDGKIGQLADTGAYGSGTMALVDSLVAEEFPDVEIVSETFPIDANNVTSQLTKLRDAGAETLAVWTYGAPLVMVMQSLDRIGWYPYIAGPLGAGDPSVVEATPENLKGKIVAGGIAAAQVADSADAEPTGMAKEFFDRFSAIAQDDEFTGLDTVASYAFDWVVALKAAIEGADSTDPEQVKAWLVDGNEIEASQGTLRFGPETTDRIGISLDDTTVYDPSQPCDNGLCVAPSMS